MTLPTLCSGIGGRYQSIGGTHRRQLSDSRNRAEQQIMSLLLSIDGIDRRMDDFGKYLYKC